MAMVAMWLSCALVLMCVVAAKGATLPGMNHQSRSPASQGVRVKGTGPGVGQHAEMQKLTQHNEMLLQKLRQSASVHSKLKDELLVVDALSRDVSGLRHSLGHVNSDESTSDALSLSQRKVQSVESVQLLDSHELRLAIESTAALKAKAAADDKGKRDFILRQPPDLWDFKSALGLQQAATDSGAAKPLCASAVTQNQGKWVDGENEDSQACCGWDAINATHQYYRENEKDCGALAMPKFQGAYKGSPSTLSHSGGNGCSCKQSNLRKMRWVVDGFTE